jgi:hypothetical protein
MITDEVEKLALPSRQQELADPWPVCFERDVGRDEKDGTTTQADAPTQAAGIDCGSQQARGLVEAALAQRDEQLEESA